jgi:beta-lactamase regulating signal transducer with metallopeptidase domain
LCATVDGVARFIAGGTIAIGAMFALVLTKAQPHDANIGAALLLVWLFLSVVLLAAALANRRGRGSRS